MTNNEMPQGQQADLAVQAELAEWDQLSDEALLDWEIEEGSDLWQSLIEIREEARQGRIQLLTHEQVFGDDQDVTTPG
jgi:hypothetical protein